jgi:curli biogenesis system outer membrane secretion channel CsgG
MNRNSRTEKLLAACLFVIAALLGAVSDGRAQAKTRVAVTAFENKVKTPLPDASWRIGEGLAEMLTTELVRTGRFIVVERQAIGDVVGEQALGQSGLVRRETAAQSGQILGAQIVVRGAVTEFADSVSGGGAGVQGRNFAVQGRADNAHVAIDLRLIDTATGQVLASHNVSKLASGAGAAFGVRDRRVAFGGDAFFQTPIGQATRAAMQEAVSFIVSRSPSAAPATSFSIVKVEGGTVYINAGANADVRVGDVFQVYSRGEDLVDPNTGLKLGSSERLVGSIQVSDVQDQFSIGTIRGGPGAMQRGDRVKFR